MKKSLLPLLCVPLMFSAIETVKSQGAKTAETIREDFFRVIEEGRRLIAAKPSDSAPLELDLEVSKRISRASLLANEADPVAKQNEETRLSMEIERFPTKSQRIKPGFVELAAFNAIRHSYTNLHYALLRVPYFLQVEIIRHRPRVRVDAEPWIRGVYKIEYDAIVIASLRGAKRFSVGDTVTFYTMALWHDGVKKSMMIGQKYIAPLEPRGVSPLSSSSPLALVAHLDKSNGFYPIRGTEVLDEHGLFGLGPEAPLERVPKSIENTISEIKSW